MKIRPGVTCLATTFLLAGPLQGQIQTSTKLSLTKLDCQVLEVAGNYRGGEKELARIHYAIVHHRNVGDRQRFSQLLRAESGTDVVFTRDNGRSHRGVIRRLRMCFGRGLLVFTEPADLKEGEILALEVQPAKK